MAATALGWKGLLTKGMGRWAFSPWAPGTHTFPPKGCMFFRGGGYFLHALLMIVLFV